MPALDLSTQLHLIAGLVALALGTAVLIREPGRLRNRLFSMLCGSLALWNLAMSAASGGLAPGMPWRVILLLGGCSAAPLSIHFAVVVADLRGRPRRVLLLVSYTLALGLWVATWAESVPRLAWNFAALGVLGALILASLVILARHARSLPLGRERSTVFLVVAAGVVAAAGGLSDFVPRDVDAFPKVGPLFALLFLLVISAVVARHRFLDVDVYFARSVALIAAATGVALLLYTTVRLFGPRFLPLFAASVVVLAAALPLGRFLMSRAEDLLSSSAPLVSALMETSRRLPLARDAGEVWKVIDEGRGALPGDVHLFVFLLDATEQRYRVAYPRKPRPRPAEIAPQSALPELLVRDRSPITRRMLHIESREELQPRRRLAREALAQMIELDARMVVPQLGEERLIGWLSLGGGRSETYLRAEVAAALLAVGQQAVASLDRIRAVDTARQREALAAVGEMATGLAHEVRNPVAAIRGAAQAIPPGSVPPQAREMLDVIEEETERLGRVVGEFLDYARPGSPRREAVDLADVARRVARDAELAGFEMQIDLEPGAGAPAAVGDPEQIRRAFENLVRNAAEAQERGGRLRISVSAVDTGVAVRFADEGPGIPPEEIPRLFQPFHSTRPTGTGLGLALVHRIVEAHGGEIHVEGRPGVGASFTLIFPAAGSG